MSTSVSVSMSLSVSMSIRVSIRVSVSIRHEHEHHVHTVHTCCHPNGDKHHVAMQFMHSHPRAEPCLQVVRTEI